MKTNNNSNTVRLSVIGYVLGQRRTTRNLQARLAYIQGGLEAGVWSGDKDMHAAAKHLYDMCLFDITWAIAQETGKQVSIEELRDFYSENAIAA